jgi:hypothetical protein
MLKGTLILHWIMRQCNEHKTATEYHRSCKELCSFLRDERTLTDLGLSCVAAIITFTESLVDKEKYLGNHIRMYTTNCSDSETTSPVESQNSIVKQKLGVNANMDIRAPLERGLCTLIVPSLFGTSYYPLPMYSPEDDFKNHRSVRIFVPVNRVRQGPLKGICGSYNFYFLFTA